MDLEICLEYCWQFNIEASYALECFVNKMMISTPTSPQDSIWARQVRSAINKMDESLVSKCLKSVLSSIHPLDYERIRFACTWLIDSHDGDDEDDDMFDSNKRLFGRSGGSGGGGGSRLVNNKNNNNNMLSPIDEDDLTNGSAIADTSATILSGISTSLCSGSSNISESTLSKYRKYMDILTFISNISIPLFNSISRHQEINWVEIHSKPEALTNPNLLHIYNGLNGMYLTRIPLWNLLDDPWGVIEPIMIAYPDIAAKLTPICKALMIDKNEFTAKKLMASYKSMRKKFNGRYSGHINICSSDSPFRYFFIFKRTPTFIIYIKIIKMIKYFFL